MFNFQIRTADFSDVPVLRRFEQGVIFAERPFDDMIKPDPVHYYDIEEMIRAEHIELVVAELDGELIGSGYARIEKSRHYMKHPVHAYLGFMYVDTAHRGKGVNGKIITALKEWAFLQKVTELRLDVYDQNLPAIRAYEKVGFSKYLVNMRMGFGE